MYTLKTPAFLRPTSRPSSPAPAPRQDTVAANDRSARPLSKLSLPNFKRTASPFTRTPAALVQDGSYMDMLSLKLSEAVSKALAQPSGPPAPHEQLGGRRPIPAGRGRALGETIASEIKASRDDQHLYRAVIRTLHRPLSVLVNNLSNNLLPLISSPAFLSPAVPTPQYPNLNPTQLHALGLSTFAGELLEVFDDLGLGKDSDVRGDGLRAIRESLVSIVHRVVDPLATALKNELMPHIEALEQPVPLAPKGTVTSKAHPSIAFMQAAMPVYARTLKRYITSTTAESTLATLQISLIWRGLVALSARPTPVSATPPGSPRLKTVVKDAKRRGSSVTPPTTPPAARFTLKLPPASQPTPATDSANRGSSIAGDARALYDLLSTLPRPSSQDAQEAVQDAYSALADFVELANFLRTRRPDMTRMELECELDRITADFCTLVALPMLLRSLVYHDNPDRTVAKMVGLTEPVYRSRCLSGFGRADECALAVGEVALHFLREDFAHGVISGTEVEVVIRWLEREIAEAAGVHH